ncbi:MAG: glycyl-radical enzyme activating protein [Clostridium sp.]|nr:glycyl-radical enzyme activating protein [Clostridium sp.]
MQANIFKIERTRVQNGPGRRTVIYFKGCPLRCNWCSHPQTNNRPTKILWDSKQCLFCRLCATQCTSGSLSFVHNKLVFDPKKCTACRDCIVHCPSRMLHFVGQMMEQNEVMDIILENYTSGETTGGVTLSGGDPLLQPKFAAAILKECRSHSIHTTVETTGYSNPLDFSRAIAHTDLLYFELKHYDERKHVQFTGVSNQSILANLDFAVLMKIPLIVRISVIPGINNAISDAHQFASLLCKHHVSDVELIHYQDLGKRKYEDFQIPDMLAENPSPDPAHLTEYANVLRSYGLNVTVSLQ